jgi:hypothetical protein
MAITTSGTTLTFNDATTQTTAPVNTNANVASATAVAGTGISVTAVTTTGAATHTITNTGVTSAVAGTGITVSGATGAVTISSTATGTVTSVATGNGLSGGTITTSGTLTLGAVGANTVGSYAFCGRWGNAYGPGSVAFNSNYAGGAGNMQTILIADYGSGLVPGSYQSDLSGTWKWLSADAAGSNFNTFGIAVRVA